jgi:hypothetical protein
MIAYHALNFEGGAMRPHPWDYALEDSSHRYVDFKAEPHLIRSTIEDLYPFRNHSFAKKLYSLIETLNGPQSLFETNDCGFRGPGLNIDSQFRFELRCCGRLMILFRKIIDNVDEQKIDWLKDRLIDEVSKIDPAFRAGAVGISRSPTGYRALSTDPTKMAAGQQIRIDMFAYGDRSSVCLYNMKKVVGAVAHALPKIQKHDELPE